MKNLQTLLLLGLVLVVGTVTGCRTFEAVSGRSSVVDRPDIGEAIVQDLDDVAPYAGAIPYGTEIVTGLGALASLIFGYKKATDAKNKNAALATLVRAIESANSVDTKRAVKASSTKNGTAGTIDEVVRAVT